MKTDKKQFALEQIAPYFKNPELCGFDDYDSSCKYLTESGNMCVAGKNMNPDFLEKVKDSSKGIEALLRYDTQDVVFFNKSANILDANEWAKLQTVHDRIAKSYDIHSDKDLIRSIDWLGLFTYDELVAKAESL